MSLVCEYFAIDKWNLMMVLNKKEHVNKSQELLNQMYMEIQERAFLNSFTQNDHFMMGLVMGKSHHWSQ